MVPALPARRTFVRSALGPFTLACVLGSCGGGGGGSGSDGGADANTSPDAATAGSVSMLVGPGGATVTGPSGVVVTIPPGAVSADFTLTISTVGTAAPPAGTTSTSVPVRLTPKTQTFAIEPTVTIATVAAMQQYQGDAWSSLVIYQGDFDAGTFTPLATESSSGNTISAKVSTLGDFIIALPPTPVRYTDNADGTLTDSETSLRWEQAPSSTQVDAAGATAACAALTLPPGSGWRVPSVHEFTRLQDLQYVGSGLPPVFTLPSLAAQGTVHTSTAVAGTAGSSWRIAGNSTVGATVDTAVGLVHCVQGTDASAPPNLVVVDANLVSDASTGLLYQRSAPTTLRMQTDAVNDCYALSLSGVTNFRLPRLRELLRIVDYTRTAPAVDATLFPGVTADHYWTSTLATYVVSGIGPFAVTLNDGAVVVTDGERTTQNNAGRVLCVADSGP